jgi:hypothetical protein
MKILNTITYTVPTPDGAAYQCQVSFIRGKKLTYIGAARILKREGVDNPSVTNISTAIFC